MQILHLHLILVLHIVYHLEMVATWRQHQGHGRLLHQLLLLWHHVVPISCECCAWSLDLPSHLWSEDYRLLVATIPLDVVQFCVLRWLQLPLVIEKDPHLRYSVVSILQIMLLVHEQLVLRLDRRVP